MTLSKIKSVKIETSTEFRLKIKMVRICCIGKASGPTGLILSLIIGSITIVYGIIKEDYYTTGVGISFPIFGIIYFFVARSSVYLRKEADRFGDENKEYKKQNKRHRELLDVEKGLTQNLQTQISTQGKLVEQEKKNNQEYQRKLKIHQKQLDEEEELRGQLETQLENRRKQFKEEQKLKNQFEIQVKVHEEQIKVHERHLAEEKGKILHLNNLIKDEQMAKEYQQKQLETQEQINDEMKAELLKVTHEREELAKQAVNLNRIQKKQVKMIQMLALYGDDCKTLGISLSDTSKELKKTDQSLGLTSQELSLQMNALKTVIDQLKTAVPSNQEDKNDEKGGDIYDSDNDYSYIEAETFS